MQTIQNQVFFKTAEGQGLFGDVMATLRLMQKRRAIYNTTIAELVALSDRELNDIGMSRSDIRTVARTAAQGV